MQLPTEFIQLPLRFDAARLAAEISALGEDVWRPHPQGFAGNDAMPLVAAGGDPNDDATAGAMAPTPALRACPYLRQVLASLGSTIGRTRLMRIVGDGEVQAHADISYYWWERVRVHVPVITSPQARFQCGERAVNMAAGECWIFDTWREHRVSNPQPEARIHLVIDTPGSAKVHGAPRRPAMSLTCFASVTWTCSSDGYSAPPNVTCGRARVEVSRCVPQAVR